MNGSLTPSTTLSAYADAALDHAVAAMRPGWIVLRDCMLDTDGSHDPARVQYALLHAEVGIALLDIIPGPTATNAAARLRRQLDAAGFHEKFRCTPEIRYFRVPLRVIPDIARLLEQEFSPRSASMLPRGGAWVALAQKLLVAQPHGESPRPAPESNVGGQRQRGFTDRDQLPTEGRRSVRTSGSARWLGIFWGLLATSVGGGALLLQYLGPPAERSGLMSAKGPDVAPGAGAQPKAVLLLRKAGSFTDAAPVLHQTRALHPTPVLHSTVEAAAGSLVSNDGVPAYATAEAKGLIDADLKRVIVENDQAITELENRLRTFEPEAGAEPEADATMSDGPSDRAPAPTAATPEEDVQPDPAPPLARDAEDPATPAPQPTATKAADPPQPTPLPATAAPATETSIAPPASDPSPAVGPTLDAPSLSRIDGQEPSPLPAASRASPSASSPDAPPDRSVDGPVDAATSPAVVPPKRPAADQDFGLDQGRPLPRGPDAPVPTPAPASAINAPIPTEDVASKSIGVAPPSAPATTKLAEVMISRADALLRQGDVSAARLLYERAAAAGSGHAATAMGKTFEASFLAGLGVTGISADPALAAAWYRRALDLGDAEARTWLQAVPSATNRTAGAQDRQR